MLFIGSDPPRTEHKAVKLLRFAIFLLIIPAAGCDRPRTGLYEVREAQLKELVAFYETSPWNRLEADARMELSRFYNDHAVTGESISEAETAARLYGKTGLFVQRFDALKAVADSKRETGDIRGALDLFDSLIDSAEEHGFITRKRDCLRSAASIHHQNTGDMVKAVAYIEKAASSARIAGDSRFELEILDDLGNILQAKGDLSGAIIAWSGALEIAETTLNYLSKKVLIERMAGSFETAGRVAEAESLLAKGISAASEAQDTSGEISFLLTLSRIRRERGDIGNGFGPARRAARLCSETGLKERRGESLKELSLLHRQIGEYELCRRSLGKAAALYEKAELPGPRAMVLRDLFDLDISVGRPASALDFALEALDLFDGIPDRSNRETLAAGLLPVITEVKGLPQAEEFFRGRLRSFHDGIDPAGEASLRMAMSRVLLDAEDPGGSRREVEAALEIYTHFDMLFPKLEALDLLALISGRQGDYDEAIKIRREIITRQMDADLKTNALMHKGRLRELYSIMGETESAETELREILELARSTGNPRIEAETFRSLAEMLRTRGEYHEALEALTAARELYRKSGDSRSLADADMLAADLLWNSGKTSDAIEACDSALEIYTGMGDLGRKLNCLNILGAYHQDSGRLHIAEETHRRALETARGIGLPAGIIFSLKNLGNVLAARADHPAAAAAYAEGANIAETAFETNAERELREKHITILDILKQPLQAAEQTTKLAGVKERQGDLPGAVHSFRDAISRFSAADYPARASTLETRLHELTGRNSTAAADHALK